MRKIVGWFLLLSLVFGFVLPVAAQESFLKVEIDLKMPDTGKQPAGTEKIRLQVYDITLSVDRSTGSSQQIAKTLFEKYGNKELAQAWIDTQQSPQILKGITPQENGTVIIDLPLFSNGKVASYLILAEGETGNIHKRPLFLLLEEEWQAGESFKVVGKYYEQVKPPVDKEDPPPKEEPPAQKDPPQREADPPRKYLPATGEVLLSCLSLGSLLVVLGWSGLIIMKKNRRKEK